MIELVSVTMGGGAMLDLVLGIVSKLIGGLWMHCERYLFLISRGHELTKIKFTLIYAVLIAILAVSLKLKAPILKKLLKTDVHDKVCRNILWHWIAALGCALVANECVWLYYRDDISMIILCRSFVIPVCLLLLMFVHNIVMIVNIKRESRGLANADNQYDDEGVENEYYKYIVHEAAKDAENEAA